MQILMLLREAITESGNDTDVQKPIKAALKLLSCPDPYCPTIARNQTDRISSDLFDGLCHVSSDINYGNRNRASINI